MIQDLHQKDIDRSTTKYFRREKIFYIFQYEQKAKENHLFYIRQTKTCIMQCDSGLQTM